MIQIIEKLAFYFEYPFVRYAMIVGVLIAACSSLLGVTLVLKRFSFIGDGLAHVAFGAVSIATILNISSNIFVTAPVTVIAAILLLRTGQNTKIKGDAAIALLSVSSLAIGYLLIDTFSKSTNLAGDVCTTLFGSTSILTLKATDVYVSVVLCLVVIAVFVFFYNRIFAVTFDENSATATGTKAGHYNLLIAVITALVIVVAMNLVGSLLISALIIFPALSAMRLFKSFKSVIVCSLFISIFSSSFGILISILAGSPVGSTIVAVQLAVFLLFSLLSLVLGGRK